MRTASFLAFVLCSAACGTHSAMSPERSAAVVSGVQAFMRTVEHDVTADGPTAWRRHFEDVPAFFMASDGRIAFATGQAAAAGIQDVARSIQSIQLHWGDDLRIDPLTPDLAMVGASWHEIQVSASGERVEESGYFTALAEYRAGRWQFRDAHWSEIQAASPTR